MPLKATFEITKICSVFVTSFHLYCSRNIWFEPIFPKEKLVTTKRKIMSTNHNHCEDEIFYLIFFCINHSMSLYSQFLQPGAKLVEWGPKEKL